MIIYLINITKQKITEQFSRTKKVGPTKIFERDYTTIVELETRLHLSQLAVTGTRDSPPRHDKSQNLSSTRLGFEMSTFLCLFNRKFTIMSIMKKNKKYELFSLLGHFVNQLWLSTSKS